MGNKIEIPDIKFTVVPPTKEEKEEVDRCNKEAAKLSDKIKKDYAEFLKNLNVVSDVEKKKID